MKDTEAPFKGILTAMSLTKLLAPEYVHDLGELPFVGVNPDNGLPNFEDFVFSFCYYFRVFLKFQNHKTSIHINIFDRSEYLKFSYKTMLVSPKQ